MGINRIQQEVGTIAALRTAVRALILLGFANLKSTAIITTVASNMTNLSRTMSEWRATVRRDMIGVSGHLPRSTRFVNDYNKLMTKLADNIVNSLSKIDCGFCQLGNVLTTGLCEARNIASGFAAIEQQPSRKAKRDLVSYDWSWSKGKSVKINKVYKYGLADTKVQGNHHMKLTGQVGPYAGTDRPLGVGIDQLTGEQAQLVLDHATKMPARVRRALQTLNCE